MIVYDKKYLRIEVIKEQKYLIQHWSGFANSDQFKEGILKALEVFKNEKLKRMISDTQNLAVVKKEDTDFAASIVPQFVQSGLDAFAFVVPSNIFTQLSVDSFTKQTSGILEIQYFDKLDLAKLWVSSKKAV